MERKVRPIYDALDARNYKQALRLSTQAVERAPDQPLLKVLKAFSLERTGKKDEAVNLCEDVCKQEPVDDHVLQMLMSTLRNLGKSTLQRLLMSADLII